MKYPVSLSAVFLAGILANAPLHATCARESCTVGPPIPCDQLLYDSGLDQGCSYWYKSSSVSIVTTSSDSYAKFSGTSSGWLKQEVFVPTGYSGQHVISLFVDIVQGSPSDTGRLRVEIRDSSALLETAEILSPSSADGRYDLDISDYGGFYVNLYFRYIPGSSPGTTEFRVSQASYFVN